jgi:hypothetical protein
MAFDSGGAGRGAVTGGITGASLGGPIGAGIGAVAGGLLGGFGGGGAQPYRPDMGRFVLPGFTSQYGTYGRLAGAAGGRQAPQMAGAQMGESGFRGGQQSLVRMLQQQASGKGPGQALVRMQAQDTADRALKQQLALQAGAAPGGGANAARTAALAGGQLQSAVGGQAAQAGLQAQLGAMGQLGGVLDNARGQDLARAQANMQSQLGTQQGNLTAQMQQTGMNDEKQLELLRQRLAASGMQQQGTMNYEQLKAGSANQMAGIQAQQPSFADRTMGQISGLAKMKMLGGSGAPVGGGGAVGAGYIPNQTLFPGLGY